MQVLIADDQEIVRRGVRSILESREGLEICGEASNGREAVNKASQLHPDLIILDQAMPVLSGVGAASEIRQFLPDVPILMLSIHDGKSLLDALRLAHKALFPRQSALTNCLRQWMRDFLRYTT
jgi:DNA-binding NarL/FixJ family response regulator